MGVDQYLGCFVYLFDIQWLMVLGDFFGQVCWVDWIVVDGVVIVLGYG